MSTTWEMTVGETAGQETLTVPAVRRSRLAGTPQQEAFWEELLTGSDNVLLEARAGTGKSTSCREGMWRLLDTRSSLTIRYCCFNKKIADEFALKCPPGVEVGTMHRFGLQALQEAFRCQIDKEKTYTILDGIGAKDLKRYVRKSINTLVSLAKNHGLRPDAPDLKLCLLNLIDQYEVECWRQEVVVLSWTVKVLERSASMTSLVDFDDMLWLTVLYPVQFPGVDYLFIDECQDLNPVQHAMAERLAGSGRTIVVGDPFQSIYAFRGADSQSIPKLSAALGAKTLPLTVTFRCPRSHVDLARQLVPDFEAADEAPEGVLRTDGPQAIENASLGSLVLCRANAPIVAACLKAIARNVPAIVRGRAIGDSLLSVIKKLSPEPSTIADFTRALSHWRAREIDRLEAKDGTENLIEGVNDRADCVDAIASSCASPSEIPATIVRLFTDDDAARRVTFSSVHRAKGSEAREVTYIQIPYSEKRDKLKPPPQWMLDQRRNLRYVALTRSLHSLTLV